VPGCRCPHYLPPATELTESQRNRRGGIGELNGLCQRLALREGNSERAVECVARCHSLIGAFTSGRCLKSAAQNRFSRPRQALQAHDEVRVVATEYRDARCHQRPC
jgi:hypothetical protein